MSNRDNGTENEIEETEAVIERPEGNPELVAKLAEVDAGFVTRTQACEILGVRVTNTSKALDTLPMYEVLGRAVFHTADVEALAAERSAKMAERAQRRISNVEKLRTRAQTAAERAAKYQAELEKIGQTDAEPEIA